MLFADDLFDDRDIGNQNEEKYHKRSVHSIDMGYLIDYWG